MNPLVALLIEELPAAIDLARAAWGRAHPDQPVPTDAEVAAAWAEAFRSSLAKDDAILAAHPGE